MSKLALLSNIERAMNGLWNKAVALFATKGEVAKKADKVHNHDDIYFTESESDKRYLMLDRGLVRDFNNCKTPGVYTISGSIIAPNAPVNEALYGTLEVIPRGGDFIQRVTTSAGQEYYRYYGEDPLKFRPWYTVFNTGTKPTWNDIANKPSSFPPTSHTHDYLPSGVTITREGDKFYINY